MRRKVQHRELFGCLVLVTVVDGTEAYKRVELLAQANVYLNVAGSDICLYRSSLHLREHPNKAKSLCPAENVEEMEFRVRREAKTQA